MLIEFVPNPSFKPPAPAIRVGSVVSFSHWKKGVVTGFQSNTAASVRPKLERIYYEELSGLTPLPLRVSGITADGEWEYAPLELPTQTYSWADYPPKAGMVVELDAESCVDRLRLLLLHGNDCIAFNKMGSCQGSGNLRITQQQYRPRPDLMPRFVQEEPPHAKP